MADLSKTIEIIFEGVDKTSGVIGGVTDDLSKLTSGVEQATAPLASLAESLLKAESAMLAVGVAALGTALTVSGKFDDSLREISTLIEISDEDLKKFRDSILDYAENSSFSFESITHSIYDAISSGIDYRESLDLIAATERLAVAGRGELDDTTKLMVQTLNSYGVGTDQATKYSDIFFQTVKDGVITIPELSEGLGRVTAAASAAGVPLEQIGAALAVLTINGLPSREAVTYLAAALQDIIKPSERSAAAAEELGIKMGASALQAGGLDGWLKSLIVATGGNVDKMKDLIGGQEAFRAVLAMTSDGGARFTEELEKMKSASGATAEAAAKMADSFELVNQRIVNAIEGMFVRAGDPLQKRWAEIGAAVAEVFKSLGQSFDAGAFDEVYKVLNEFADKVIGLFNELAKNLPDALGLVDFGPFADALRGLAEAIANLFSGVDLSTPQGLSEAIQNVVNAITGMTNATTGVVQGLTPFLTKLWEAAQAFSNLSPEAQNASGKVLGFADGINKMAGFAGEALSALKGLELALGAIAASQVVKLVLGLVAALGGAGLAAAAAVVGPILAAIAVTLGSAAFGYWVQGALGLSKELTGLGASGLIADEALGRMDLSLRQLSTAAGAPIKDMEQLHKALSDGVPIWDNIAEKWIGGGEALTGVGESADKTKVTFDDFGNILIDAGKGMVSLDTSAAGLDSSLGRQAQAASESATQTNTLQAALSALASDERLMEMKFSMELNVAEVQANAQIATAALNGLASTITSTGNLLGTLFGLLANPDNHYQDKILAQIEKENAMREEAFALQTELTQTQIDYMQARTDAILKNDALITIDGAGLQPQLEAFMFEVLRAIQVKVNEDGLEMLVGL